MNADPAEVEKEIQETGASSKIDINKRLFYEIEYADGSTCKVNDKPRKTRVHFYCDQYRAEKDKAVSVLDISEPDYCEYLIKVSTRFMCAAGTQFRKASSRLHTGGSNSFSDSFKPELDLDAGGHTVHKNMNCKIKSEF